MGLELATWPMSVLSGAVCGSGLFWSAPEILRNPLPPRNGTQKADVYSIGILLYNIIYRLPPFHTDSDNIALPRGTTCHVLYNVKLLKCPKRLNNCAVLKRNNCIRLNTINPARRQVLPRSEWLYIFYRRQTNEQTDKQMNARADRQMDSITA